MLLFWGFFFNSYYILHSNIHTLGMLDGLPGVACVCHFDAMNTKFIRNVFQVLQSLCIGPVVFTHFGVICVIQHADKLYERVIQHLKSRLENSRSLYPPEIE